MAVGHVWPLPCMLTSGAILRSGGARYNYTDPADGPRTEYKE